MQTPVSMLKPMNSVPFFNMTYQTLAISWINHGFTDVQKCEYEILVRLVPMTSPRLMENEVTQGTTVAEKLSLVKTNLLKLEKIDEEYLASSPS